MSFYLAHIALIQDPEVAPLELGNIMEPDPIAFSFNTIGWKVVFVILGVLILYGIYRLYLKYKHNQYRRDAVAEIKTLKQDPKLPEMLFITKCVFILKRTALQSYQREKVASLEGDAWLEFLDAEVRGSHFKTYKEDIANAVYKETFNNTNFNKEAFFQMSLKWIKHHA
ncbi:DUF4381 domain-containing protein [Xanthomarina sp. F1114]|uniref:DUF4381 domain-containing protein n=1 Tax=Xanthomarina sp. F1114 TaxID=2996019 RepID=UPI00225E0085|nr:DUF4381 domain-containing protein [Xanthomarina sp. F1114]MCX7546648.1 DUF4381 domain-containing protein [Xanthomarina sp. F1114]